MKLTSFRSIEYRHLCCGIFDPYLDYLAVFSMFWLIWIESVTHFISRVVLLRC